MVEIVRHCQAKATETDRLDLNYSRHCSTRLSEKSVKADGEKGVAVMRGVQGRHLPDTQNWRTGGNET
jgi:hypothetical protein